MFKNNPNLLKGVHPFPTPIFIAICIRTHLFHSFSLSTLFSVYTLNITFDFPKLILAFHIGLRYSFTFFKLFIRTGQCHLDERSRPRYFSTKLSTLSSKIKGGWRGR